MQQLQQLYIGTYTEPILFGTGEIMQGKGKGIHLAEVNLQTGVLIEKSVACKAANPSFLNFSEKGDFLYAVNELKEYNGAPGGAVSAFAVGEKGSLAYINTQPTLGTDPCHVVVSPDGSCAIVSNFMSGSVCVYPIAENGSLQPHSQFIQHEGSSVNPRRQKGPHAHSATFDASGQFVLVPDLGVDKVFVYRLDTGACRLTKVWEYLAPPGAGPRYCEFHPTLPICYLINELSSSISVLSFDSQSGKLNCLQTITTLAEPFDGENICADLHITTDGRYLYGSNRGHDSLVAYALDDTGAMTYLQTISSGGRTPRNFVILPGDKLLLVGNQDSDNLVTFSIDANTGRLTALTETKMPTPVCVRPVGM